MKQEDKELLLKDLTARLPYGVKVQDIYYNSFEPAPVWLIDINAQNVRMFADEGYQSIEHIRPYLFPLSSMTEKQEEELITITDGKFRYMWGVITNAIPRKNTSEWGVSENAFIDGIEVINILYIWLLKNHFDIYGLIPMGLAIDATNKKIY